MRPSSPPSSLPRIVIAGLGPAGAAASLFLSQHGIPHLILEKADAFPRDKVCGDALSGKVLSVLRKLDPEVEQRLRALESPVEGLGGKQELNGQLVANKTLSPCYGVRFTAPGGTTLDLPFKPIHKATPQGGEPATNFDYPSPGYIAKRLDFDDFLYREVIQHPGAGLAEVRLGHALQKVVARPHRTASKRQVFSLEIKGPESSGGTYELEADILLGAEGERSVVARALADYKLDRRHHSAGIRQYYTNVHGFPAGNMIELHFIKEFLPGYLWVFPLPNGGANVGAGMLSSKIKKSDAKSVDLKKMMHTALSEHPFFKERFADAKPAEPVRGWGLPLGSKRVKRHGEGWMTLGDAASLIDPFTGEGIGNALKSGMYAADAIADALSSADWQSEGFEVAFAKFDARCERAFATEFRASYWLQRLLGVPGLFDFVVRKANKNTSFKDTLSSMFDAVDLRKEFRSPRFWWRVAFG